MARIQFPTRITLITSISSVIILALSIMLSVCHDKQALPAKTCGDPRNLVPLFSGYRIDASDHFYTTNRVEMQTAITTLGYSDKGTTGYIFGNYEPRTIPLYHMYSVTAQDHFYTADFSERDTAINHLGYIDEGILGYIYPETRCGGLPLYRLYGEREPDHFYTMSVSQRDTASNELDYKQEGIVGYIFPL